MTDKQTSFEDQAKAVYDAVPPTLYHFEEGRNRTLAIIRKADKALSAERARVEELKDRIDNISIAYNEVKQLARKATRVKIKR